MARVKSSDIRVVLRDAYLGSRVLKVAILAVHLRSAHTSRDARRTVVSTARRASVCCDGRIRDENEVAGFGSRRENESLPKTTICGRNVKRRQTRDAATDTLMSSVMKRELS